MAALIVTANSWNSRPMMPDIRNSGMNTAISDRLIETMVKPISPAPRIAAARGAMPSSMWRWMFSSITIASSTTKPAAMASAMSERLSRLKPSASIAAKVATRLSGTVTAGITVPRTLRRKAKITPTTRPTVISSAVWTSATEARMVWVRSLSTR
jgi:hypothetical protein